MRGVRRTVPVLVVAVVVLVGGWEALDGERTAAVSAGEGRVVRVVDGDTLRVMVGGTEEKVRLIGVDTPESVRPGEAVECFGREASAFLERLVAGRRVRLELDAERRDRYGRLLAYVHRVPDRLFVNAELVSRGYAQPLTIAPNVRFAERFRELSARARRARVGLWGAC